MNKEIIHILKGESDASFKRERVQESVKKLIVQACAGVLHLDQKTVRDLAEILAYVGSDSLERKETLATDDSFEICFAVSSRPVAML